MLKPKYIIELYDINQQQEGLPKVGFRVLSGSYPETKNGEIVLETDADFLVVQLTETLSRIGQIMPVESVNEAV